MTISANNSTPKATSIQAPMPTDENGQLVFPADKLKLTSALRSLKNKRDARVTALHFVAPMVREARMFPDTAHQLHDMAHSWFKGTLGGVSTKMSPAVGVNGVGGDEFFEALWTHFMKQPPYKGRPRMIASIYFMAKDEASWEYEPEEEAATTDVDAY